ncbi:3-demethylubiquinone-9 3-methyltransferase protein [Zychaea mexicana]|uniref:3-demethylubiquinone-9 3-methyltransferase protein n=1 Tax=Zychaea mexicana TaxID=64656 RepID=UPI0022FEBD93|nr:3-demethylubiquinone-9 3-methyltransferase protein [Zychaea mexicana]KAI9494956.1 3-demethylubiquinone-9 3-methyltransferase protein [Zychaea mexicana]
MWRNRIYQYVSRRRFSTIDASEVRKFSEKSAEWWDPDGEFGMLQLMNPARVRYVREQLGFSAIEPKPFQNMKMLDIGCGGGLLSESLTRLGGRVLGADASPDNIKMAQIHKRQDPQLWRGPGQLYYRHTTAEDLLASKESFDVVLAMEIIEHVNNPLQFLRTCGDLVRPGGTLFLSTMSRTFASYLLTVALAEDVLRLVHQGTHDWTKYITSKELISAVESMGQDWAVQDVRGVFWDPACRQWRVAQEKGLIGAGGLESLEVNYFLTAKRKIVGDADDATI